MRLHAAALVVLVTACAAGPVTSASGPPIDTRSEPIASAATTEPLPDLGPELSPEATPPLPAEGVAVTMGTTVVLVDLAGAVVGHLDGLTIDVRDREPGPIPLADTEGGTWLLDGNGLSPAEPDRVPLAFGAELLAAAPGDPAGVSRIVRNGETLFEGASTEVFPSWDRSLVTLTEWRQAGPTIEPVTSSILDLSTGERLDSPAPGCHAVERRREGFVVTCRGGESATIELVGDGIRTVLAPAPDADRDLPSGHWRRLIPSPDGRAYLGQWSGECESLTAVWVEEGRSVPITGLPLAEAPASSALGWTGTGEAVVFLAGEAPCASPASEPGLYLAESPASLTLLYPVGDREATVRMWRPLPGR